MPGLYSDRYSSTEIQAHEAAYDPVRVEMLVKLIPVEFVEQYLYAGAKVREYEMSLEEAESGGGLMMMSMEAVTNLVITGLARMTNGLRIEISYPEAFTNRVEIFRASNLMERDWERASDPLATTGSTSIVWLDTEFGADGVAFYAVGNYDLDTDPNSSSPLLPPCAAGGGYWVIRLLGNSVANVVTTTIRAC